MEQQTVPPYTVIDSIQGEEGSLVLMCKGIRFCIDVQLTDLRDHSSSFSNHLEKQFIRFRDNIDEDARMMEAFDEWAVNPCLDFIRQHAPKQIDRENFTLKNYYDPPTYFIKLVNGGGSLRAMQRPDDGFLLRRHTPQISPSSLTVLPDQLRDVDRVDASQLHIMPGNDETDLEFCAIPKVVQAKGSDERMFFKAAFDAYWLNRELEVYLRYKHKNHSIHGASKSRVPDLVALVQREDGSLLGFVTEYVHHTTDFRHAASCAPRSAREKWKDQIEATVSDLHAMGLVWGGVKPEDVVIDAHGDAYVINFNGGYSPDWVDEALAETREGDVQGMSKMRHFLGL